MKIHGIECMWCHYCHRWVNKEFWLEHVNSESDRLWRKADLRRKEAEIEIYGRLT